MSPALKSEVGPRAPAPRAPERSLTDHFFRLGAFGGVLQLGMQSGRPARADNSDDRTGRQLADRWQTTYSTKFGS